MPELDAFERSLEVALRAFADRGATAVDAVEFAEHVAGRPRRRSWLAGLQPDGRLAAVPAAAWFLLVAGLLLALVVGALVGSRRQDHALVIAPPAVSATASTTPKATPSSPTATIDPAVATILATTRAKPLPAQATCRSGSEPDAVGPAGQRRPQEPASGFLGPMAFDRHAGRIVLAADDGAWTFDVCTNVWQRMRTAQGSGLAPDERPDWLVYDADSDRTVAFTPGGQFWSYDLVADRWAKAGSFPEVRRGWGWGSWATGAIYHDPSGLIVVYDGATMWAYDVESATLTEITQRPDPSLAPGDGMPPDPLATVDAASHYDGSGGAFIGYDPRSDLIVTLVRPARPGGPTTTRPADETWTFEPGDGTWWRVGGYWNQLVDRLEMAGGPAIYDEVSGLLLFPDGLVFDGGQRAWRRERSDRCAISAYDPLNGRIVCLGGTQDGGAAIEDVSAVSAFSTATRDWRWLLEPLTTASPAP